MKFTKDDIVFTDGKIDVESTVAKFSAELAAYAQFQEESLGLVYETMVAALNRWPGARMNVPFVVSETLNGIREKGKLTPSNHALYEEKAHEMLSALKAQGYISIDKGPKGGVKRIDASAPKAETTETK
jgi:hypothetical protein